MEQLKTLIKDITDLFDNKKVKDIDTSIEMVNNQYELLVELFDTSNNEDKLWACRYAITSLLPLVQRMLASPKVGEDKIGQVYEVYKKTYAFCARRSLYHFIEYMEWDRSSHKKVFANRHEVLDAPVYYLNKMIFDDKLQYFRLSMPPSFAKSFLGNYFSAWCFGLDINNSILRMSVSESVAFASSRYIKDLLISDLFSDVFPEYKALKGKIFSKEKDSEWRISSAETVVSHYAKTREASTVGIRANLAIIFDDMTSGLSEAHNDDVHNTVFEQFMTEWVNRKDNDRVKYIFLGTMWNNRDLLTRIKEAREKVSPIRPSKRFKYVEESDDGTSVFITIPLLDENDKSTCEHATSTKVALEFRENTDEFTFSCVYQQTPIAPSGREFAYENLTTYDTLPKIANPNVYAVLDPTRKGKDNISMPIFVKSDDGEEHYLIDWYYKPVAMTEAYDEIVSMIVTHRITHFHIENNTDTSLATLLEMKLKERNYNNCDVSEVYNTVNKEVRIKDARGLIKRKMRFKQKGSYSTNSMIGKAMEAFTTYSFDFPNKRDDAPDSLALYVNKFILEEGAKYVVQAVDRSMIGF